MHVSTENDDPNHIIHHLICVPHLMCQEFLRLHLHCAEFQRVGSPSQLWNFLGRIAALFVFCTAGGELKTNIKIINLFTLAEKLNRLSPRWKSSPWLVLLIWGTSLPAPCSWIFNNNVIVALLIPYIRFVYWRLIWSLVWLVVCQATLLLSCISFPIF